MLTVPIEKNNYFQKIKDTKIKDYSSLGKFHLDKIKMLIRNQKF